MKFIKGNRPACILDYFSLDHFSCLLRYELLQLCTVITFHSNYFSCTINYLCHFFCSKRRHQPDLQECYTSPFSSHKVKKVKGRSLCTSPTYQKQIWV